MLCSVKTHPEWPVCADVLQSAGNVLQLSIQYDQTECLSLVCGTLADWWTHAVYKQILRWI